MKHQQSGRQGEQRPLRRVRHNPEQRETQAERYRAPEDERAAPAPPRLETVAETTHHRVDKGVERTSGEEHPTGQPRFQSRRFDQKKEQKEVDGVVRE